MGGNHEKTDKTATCMDNFGVRCIYCIFNIRGDKHILTIVGQRFLTTAAYNDHFNAGADSKFNSLRDLVVC